MDVSLYQAAAAMNATEQWQDLIAENLGTSSIPGARKREISFSAVQAGIAQNLPGSPASRFVIPAASAAINFKQGELSATGGQTDFALEGKGFFSLVGPNGRNIYTRDGQFRLDSQGQLVSKQGDPVEGESGPIRFSPNNPNPITISSNGMISQGADAKGKLKVVEFADPQQLTMLSSGYFRMDDAGQPPLPSPDTTVRQGFTEGSNTTATAEMSGLITAMRMFETNQKVMVMQNDRTGRVITELGAAN